MTIFKSAFISAAAALTLAACGASETNASGPEKAVQKQPVVAESSTPEAAETAPVAAGLEFAALPAPYNEADYARGKRTFKLCQSCHTVAEGGTNLVGPNLYGMFGREIGAVEGFKYSEAVEGADFIWTPEKLAEWLESPRAFLPGNRMSFSGVRKEEDRMGVIAYLMVETGYETPIE